MRAVVGVALYDGAGRVLAARRHTGGWEFPGGKVEPGERHEQTAIRECEEELGVRIEVDGSLDGAEPCGNGYLLYVLAGRITEGVPANLDHAELRWVDRDELGTLAWLPADVPFLPGVAARL